MSNSYNNIEDLFKDKFEGAKATPAENLWDNIEKSLDAETYFEKKFKDFKVHPNSRIWYNIQRKLNFIDFMSFGLTRFNIYYFLLLLISISILIYISVPLQPIDGLAVNPNSPGYTKNRFALNATDYIPKNYEYVNSKNDVVSDLLDNVFNDELNIEQHNNNKKSNTQPGNNNEPVNSNMNSEPNLTTNSTTEPSIYNTESPNNSTIIASNNIISPRYNYHIDTKTISSPNYLTNKSYDLKINSTQLLEIYVNDIDNHNELIGYLDHQKPILLPMTDHLPGYIDIERNDTLCKNAFGDHIIIPRSSHSVDIFYNRAFTSAIFTVANPEMPYFLNEFKESHKPFMSDNFGIHYNYEYKKFRLQTGVQYSQYKQEFRYSEEYTIVDTSYITNEIPYFFTVYDTIWFIDMDHYNQTGQIDSIAKIIPSIGDSVHIVNVARYDTTSESESFNSINRYKYIELPLIMGYRIGNKKLNFTPKAGIIAGLLINVSGKTLNYSDNSQIVDLHYNNQPYIKPNISYIASLEINYNFNESFGIVIDPYFQKNINSIFEKSYPVNQRFSIYGIKMGLRYNF